MSKYIPEGIAFTILLKLPLKSLKRFGCVCKSWSLLFANHRFMNMFRGNFLSNLHRCSYYNQASLLLKFSEPEPLKEVFYSLSGEMFENKVKLNCSNPFPNHEDTRIFGFGSINGTLCLYDDNYNDKIVLWNPTTDTFKLLPPSPVVESVGSSDDAEDFDGLYDYCYIYGFGYDGLTNDYKVIRYISIIGEHAGYGDISIEGSKYESLYPFWEIYSVRSNSWKKLDGFDMPYSTDYKEGTYVYMDGVCHWFCFEDRPDEQCLVSFNLSNEEFFITPIPLDDD
jgi:molecular chaperone HtpG